MSVCQVDIYSYGWLKSGGWLTVGWWGKGNRASQKSEKKITEKKITAKNIFFFWLSY